MTSYDKMNFTCHLTPRALHTYRVHTMIIDRASPLPLYQQVKSHLLDRLTAGDFPQGTKLASERELIERLGVSRITVRQAMRELVMEGHLQSAPGKGFYPAAPRRRSYEINLVRSFTDTARAHGGRPEGRLLDVGLVPAEAIVAQLLGVSEGTEVVHLRRLRLLDDIPVMLCDDWLLADRVPGLLDLDWSVGDRSLFAELIGRYGVYPRRGHTEIGARLATETEADHLRLVCPAAVLIVDQVAYDADWHLINASTAVQHPDLFPMKLDQGGTAFAD